MLCSIDELGLTVNDFPYTNEDGIFILQEQCNLGDDIRDVLMLRDTIVDFELTFNRPDCQSYLGIARESAAALGVPLNIKEPVVKRTEDGDNIEKHLKVEVKNTVLCPRYTARMLKNVKIAPSPLWLRSKLRSAGVRPINNIVDITNYVMIEYGQPMHAFDYNYLASKSIIVRNAREGESIITLDNAVRNLSSDMLCIADGENAVALAGIIGGLNSGIKDNTATVVFESANFNRENIRHTSRALGIRTESSARFEKGLPACNTLDAVNRAVELAVSIGVGEVVDGIIDIVGTDIGERTLNFDYKRVNRLLGTDISFEEMALLLLPLGLKTDSNRNLVVPPFRGDIVNTADIAEEVARLYGYDKIPENNFTADIAEGGLNQAQKFRIQASHVMVSLGFLEIYTFSFISPKLYDKIRLPSDSELRDSIKLINPLGEDTSVMRTTALPSMLESVSRNFNHRIPSCRLFENATVYKKCRDMSLEEKNLVFAFYGSGDFYDAKGYVEGVFDALRVKNYEIKSVSDDPAFHPGRCAEYFVNGRFIAKVGQIHPQVADNFDIGTVVYAAVLSIPAIYEEHEADIQYKPLPQYPSVERDLALITDEAVEAGTLCKNIMSYSGKSLISAVVFDVYRGKGVDENKKSVAVRLTFRLMDRTMTEEEVDTAVKKILKKLDSEMGITLRV